MTSRDETALRVKNNGNSSVKRYKGPLLQGDRSVINKGEEGYPDALMCIADPPSTLYIIGNPDALQEGLAVIGARKATPYGISCTQKFVGYAAERGLTIISGGARGCDSAAHEAAIDAGGTTVAFLGGGCDELYPASNHGLFQRIIESGGAVVSEHQWGFPPLPHTFRLRNRLIAGLARATLIVEAGLPSGTFSTADEALAANREVLVVPGAITSPTSRGANQLLFQGATPIVDDDTFSDVLFSIFGLLRQEFISAADKSNDRDKGDAVDQRDVEDPLLMALKANPLRVEEMLSIEGYEKEKSECLTNLMVHLMDLQHRGEITRFPDGRYGPKRIYP